MKPIIPLVFLCTIFVANVFGQTVSIQPSVSVVGEAEFKVEPDQVEITFEIVTFDSNVVAAKKANDEAAAKTIIVAKSFGVQDAELQTDRLLIAPRTAPPKDPRSEGKIIDYAVTKSFVVTFKQLDRIDEFLSKAIEAGVNRITNISIGNSTMAKFEQQVRLSAIDNAREKAESYAKRLNLKVGRAYVIREESADTPGYTSGYGSGSGSGNGTGDGSRADDLEVDLYSRGVSFALGRITLEDKIYVIFELKP